MVDILLATYNGANYLREQLDSLLAQSYKNLRIIANDDCSSDNTWEILNEYKTKYPDIFVLSRVKRGSAKDNFYYLMSRSDAEYVCFCDQDDVWLDNKIEIELDALKKIDASKPGLVFSDLVVVDKNKKVICNSELKYQNLNGKRTKLNQLILQNVITGCTIMANRKLVDMYLEKGNHQGILMHDWWIGLIASAFGEIAFIDRNLVLYRQHDNNTVGAIKNCGIRYFVKQLFSFDKIRKSLALTRDQSRIFGQLFDVKLAKEYGDLSNSPWFERAMFYLLNGVYFEGFAECIGLLVLG